MAGGQVVRFQLRLKGAARRPLDARLFLRFPGLFRLGARAVTRLRLGSRLRGVVLRRAIELVVAGQNRGDFELTFALYSPDNELRNVTTGGATASILGLEEVYRGPEGVRRFFEEWAEPWEHWHWGPTGELVDLGGGKALALLLLVGRGRGSGIEVREQVGLMAEIVGGSVVRQQNWLGSGAWDEALRVALAEQEQPQASPER